MRSQHVTPVAYDANINEGLGFTPALTKRYLITTEMRRLYQTHINSIAQELRVIDGSFRQLREPYENKVVPDAIKHLKERGESKAVQDAIKKRRRRHLTLKDLERPLWQYEKALEPLEAQLEIAVPAYARSSCLTPTSKLFILPRELRDIIYGYLLDEEMLPQMHNLFHRNLNGVYHDWHPIAEKPHFLDHSEFADPQFVYETYEHAHRVYSKIREKKRIREQERIRERVYFCNNSFVSRHHTHYHW